MKYFPLAINGQTEAFSRETDVSRSCYKPFLTNGDKSYLSGLDKARWIVAESNGGSNIHISLGACTCVVSSLLSYVCFVFAFPLSRVTISLNLSSLVFSLKSTVMKIHDERRELSASRFGFTFVTEFYLLPWFFYSDFIVKEIWIIRQKTYTRLRFLHKTFHKNKNWMVHAFDWKREMFRVLWRPYMLKSQSIW